MHFIDTNVVMYSLGLSSLHESKRLRAREILDQPGLAVSVQVLQEFYTQATRRSRKDPLDHITALAVVRSICEFPVQEMTLDVMNAAFATCQRYRISYWDAAIVEAARALGCRTVYSEDMPHGQDYGGVRVVDPFR